MYTVSRNWLMTKCKFTIRETQHSEISWYAVANSWFMSLQKGDTFTTNNQTFRVVSRHLNADTQEVEFMLCYPES